MKLHATIESIKIDGEGESTLVLKIPLSDLSATIELTKLIQQLTEIHIQKSSEKYYELIEL